MSSIDIKKYIKKYLSEAPVRDDSDMPMDRDVKRMFDTGETPLSDNPSFPDIEPEEDGPENFEQKAASETYKEVVDNLKRLTGIQNINPGLNGVQQLSQLMMNAFGEISRIESENKELLTQLAIDLAKKETGIDKEEERLGYDFLKFDAKLVNMGQVSQEGFQTDEIQPDEEDIEQYFAPQGGDEDEDDDFGDKFFEALDNFDEERAKRTVLNAMIQGEAMKGHYAYRLISDVLDRINPRLVELYGVAMSIAQMIPWLLPPQIQQQMAGNNPMVGGKESIDVEKDEEGEDIAVVRAEAIMFPILVHELIKGIGELGITTQFSPDELGQKKADMVMGMQDTLVNELWDQRVGPYIYKKLREAYPDELFEEGKVIIQFYLKQKIASLDNKEFFNVMQHILKGTEQGQMLVKKIVQEIEEEIKNAEYEDAIGGDDDGGFDETNIDDLDLDDLF